MMQRFAVGCCALIAFCGVIVLGVRIVQGWSADRHSVPIMQEVEDATAVSQERLFEEFRKAAFGRDVPEFEKWALELIRRRSLRGLGYSEVEAALGRYPILSRTYADPEFDEEKHSFLGRLFARRVDYWYYKVDNYPDGVPYDAAGLGIAFKGNRVLWSFYERGDMNRTVNRIVTRYPDDRQGGADVNQNGQGDGGS